MRKSVISAAIAMSAVSLTACGSSSSDSAKTTTTSVSSSTSVSSPTSSATPSSTTASATQTSSTTVAPSPTSTSAAAQKPITTAPVAPTRSTQNPAAAPATSSSTPKTSAAAAGLIAPNATLGLSGWGTGRPNQEGFGQTHPNTIFNGGDPTGMVTNVKWNSWGGKMATGTGVAEYVGPNQSVAEGHQEPVKIVAYNLTTCGDHPAYRHVVWYFPQYGETFQKAVADGDESFDLCNG